MTHYEITASDLVHVTGRIRRARFKINGAPVKLAGRKAVLFAILAAACSIRPGATVTTRKLLDLLDLLDARGAIRWRNPNEISLYQVVWALRKAIKDAGKNPAVIETMDGGGYRLNTPNALVDDSVMKEVPELNDSSRGWRGPAANSASGSERAEIFRK